MKVNRIFETVLYAEDLVTTEKFYRSVLGLEILHRSELFVVFRCGGGVLLIFDPKKSRATGRDVPSHGAIGPGHLAFGVCADDLDMWRDRLIENGVEIESEVKWDSGGLSIYFRDPAGNSIELAPPTLWGGRWAF
jgi:catechol-2,3-dioxygenase